MKIKWLGHAAFLVTSDTGTRVLTDPYSRGEYLCYDEIKETADIVTVSHEHFDHNNAAAVKGSPTVVKATTEAKGIKIRGIKTFHDESQGKERGTNTIFCFEVSGINICHLGDLGHALSDKTTREIGKVDVLLIPVGGLYTFGTAVANQISDQLKPKVIIPMHYKTDKCSLPIATADEFLKGKNNVTRLDSSEVEFKPSTLPPATKIIVLKPAL